MTNLIWHDRVTGVVYQCDPAWVAKVRKMLVSCLRAEIANTTNLRSAADAVARFWREHYYQLVFPLRVGLAYQQQWLETPEIFSAEAQIQLTDHGQRLRTGYLDENSWPPILPDPGLGEQGWLQVDRLLVEAACCNVVLAQVLPAAQLPAVRLAALMYPFMEAIDLSAIDPDRQVSRLATLFQAQAEVVDLHDALSKIIAQICTSYSLPVTDWQVGLVAVAVQRVKQYVFESSGLNEIRGASTVLDQVTDDLAQAVGEQIGPEVILRAAGSSLLYLAPADQKLMDRPAAHRRQVFRETGTAFPAAAAVKQPLAVVLSHFSEALRAVQTAMGADRAQAHQPNHITYPFETRCDFCLTRPAQQQEYFADRNPLAICKVCATKRRVGREQRKGKVRQILSDLHLLGGAEVGVLLTRLAVAGESENDWLADDLSGLIHDKTRRRLLGVVYADGNNFGTFAFSLNTIALSLQWSARVAHTTRAATALALGRAIQWVAQQRGWNPQQAPFLTKVPFQVLALGGDDVSLFAWAPVAIYFAAEFTRLTDHEFAHVDPKRSLHFSAGVLLTDEKTPVLKSVDFTEEELLKWAKKANKAQELTSGNIAVLYAETAESVPTNLERHRATTYLIGAEGTFQLCTTLRPYLAAELRALLEIAAYIQQEGNLGQLERLIGAFYGARQSAFSGMLHYAYQKGRQSAQTNGGWIAKLERRIIEVMGQIGAPPESALLIDYRAAQHSIKARHPPFGLGKPLMADATNQSVRFSHLSDLLELTKILT